ncbi:hypothetical protein NHP194003_07700 [Helicobacter suis]|uniref:Uncharacterized protein n=1 Tax=Helicobacter suis TaxID=104628 RepID=A0A6J4CZD3_9HELI|nr:hypothetical protein NHP190020_15630 [Helicobacter suis]BDR28617.1 hypothetical protein HSHS1_13780 [Helicobacter suis HS1]BCD47566.1 hypothetical protein NHP194003_07700 [Helicobacter suis]BCD49320.1 hypothetical protein NHP194004_07670 [Helicobacter suis]BCD51356.1 hypothetical protein NHP194022_10270 [Helicobacter suis]
MCDHGITRDTRNRKKINAREEVLGFVQVVTQSQTTLENYNANLSKWKRMAENRITSTKNNPRILSLKF